MRSRHPPIPPPPYGAKSASRRSVPSPTRSVSSSSRPPEWRTTPRWASARLWSCSAGLGIGSATYARCCARSGAKSSAHSMRSPSVWVTSGPEGMHTVACLTVFARANRKAEYCRAPILPAVGRNRADRPDFRAGGPVRRNSRSGGSLFNTSAASPWRRYGGAVPDPERSPSTKDRSVQQQRFPLAPRDAVPWRDFDPIPPSRASNRCHFRDARAPGGNCWSSNAAFAERVTPALTCPPIG